MRSCIFVLICCVSPLGIGGLPAATAQKAAETANGRLIFHEKGCEHCHGENLRGTDKGPSLLGVGRRMSASQRHRQIHEGGDNMPAFGDALNETEEDDLVKFLGTLKVKGKPAKK
jgi:mono/diheme cytochrome c family protein